MGRPEDDQSTSTGPEGQSSANAPPAYDDAKDNADDAHQAVATTAKFPPVLNVYLRWSSMTTVYLGPSGDDHRYAVSTSWKGALSLHDGPSSKHPVLATATVLKGSKWRDSAIHILPRNGQPGVDITLKGDYERKHPFSLPVGPTGSNNSSLEFFEWRQSRAGEVKELQGFGMGWKLVRLMGEEVGLGGERDDRAPGFASDGKEIVAVAAQGAFKFTKKSFKIAFVGTGLTGALGENWEIAVVMSAMRIREVQNQQTAAATSAAAA